MGSIMGEEMNEEALPLNAIDITNLSTAISSAFTLEFYGNPLKENAASNKLFENMLSAEIGVEKILFSPYFYNSNENNLKIKKIEKVKTIKKLVNEMDRVQENLEFNNLEYHKNEMSNVKISLEIPRNLLNFQIKSNTDQKYLFEEWQMYDGNSNLFGTIYIYDNNYNEYDYAYVNGYTLEKAIKNA